MINAVASPKVQGKEAHPYLASLLALALITLCLIASHWQYQRGVVRHHLNSIIASHIQQTPVTLPFIHTDLLAAEWRQVSVTGKFDRSHQILLRNRYFEGKYGLHLLTLFMEEGGKSFWVNRGWIAPAPTIVASPTLPFTSTENVEIIGRVRLDSSLPRGSFFALPSSESGKLIERWNAQSKNNSVGENFYVDLITSSDKRMNPAAPVDLPELSDGPHMAYALQWLFFAALAGYGRILIRRSR